jgi:outer membrane biosynthesis protein TonB
MPTAWPQPTDYNVAIQSPALCFADAELRQGVPELLPTLGVPRACSGNFADVYRLDAPAGAFAVKCFTRPVADLARRYRTVAEHVRQQRRPFLVDFDYLEKGVFAAGAWWPVVKMRWAEGQPLNAVVRAHLDRPAVLERLARMWARLAEELRGAGIGHGDLQHGNVLLVPGRKDGALALKLVDYDGLFVPALAGSPPGERGHASYQHPARAEGRGYGPAVDHFAHLVIYVALRALASGGAGLWERFDNGDNLLFRAGDFRAPASSPLFAELSRHPDGEVRGLAHRLADACAGPPERVPFLPDLLGAVTVPPPVTAARPVPPLPAGRPVVYAAPLSVRRPGGKAPVWALAGVMAGVVLLTALGLGAWLAWPKRAPKGAEKRGADEVAWTEVGQPKDEPPPPKPAVGTPPVKAPPKEKGRGEAPPLPPPEKEPDRPPEKAPEKPPEKEPDRPPEKPPEKAPEQPPERVPEKPPEPARERWVAKDPALLLREGGSARSDEAVEEGLRWLALHQANDGHWGLHDFNKHARTAPWPAGAIVPNTSAPGTTRRNDTAGTALALLPFLAAGITNKPPAEGKGPAAEYHRAVRAGLNWLIAKQSKGRADRGHFGGDMYTHALATIALCEAYRLSRDPLLRAPAQAGINFLVGAQDLNGGGWRYSPRQSGDLSVTGFCLRALSAGRRAGLTVPAAVLTRAGRFLDSAETTRNSGGYGYVPNQGETYTMTAVGLLCRQNLRANPPDPGLRAGLMKLRKTPPGTTGNLYYEFYATQVMYHMGGADWAVWNLGPKGDGVGGMRDSLIARQDKGEKVPANRGSWAGADAVGGRIGATSFALLTLQVYFQRGLEGPPPPGEVVQGVLSEISVPSLRGEGPVRPELLPAPAPEAMKGREATAAESAVRRAVRKARVTLWAVSPAEPPAALAEQVADVRKKLRVDLTALKGRYAAPSGPADEARLKKQLLDDMKDLSRIVFCLQEALEGLEDVAARRAREDRRWQAHYDFIKARVLAQLAHLEEHQALLGQMRRELPPLDRARHSGWRLAPSETVRGGREVRRYAAPARKGYEALIREHPGTPWEALAHRELAAPPGLVWQPAE